MKRIIFSLFFLLTSLSWTANLFSKDDSIPNKVFPTSYDRLWSLLLKEMLLYELSIANKLTGQIKTRWIDDTQTRKFLSDAEDDPSDDQSVFASRFNLLIQVNPVLNTTTPAAKVTIFKRQMVMTDDSKMQWEVVPSDLVLEKTLLYRIERIVELARDLPAKGK